MNFRGDIMILDINQRFILHELRLKLKDSCLDESSAIRMINIILKNNEIKW